MLGLFDEKVFFDPGHKSTTEYDLGDATLILRERFIEREYADNIYAQLLANAPWKQRERKMYDKMVLDPRLTAWYDDNNSNNWLPALREVQQLVQQACGISFNSVLLNLYRDGKDSVSWHSDTKPPGGHQPIASVSFGQTRAFHVRHKINKDIPSFSIPLTHGSFLLMPASMQEHWEHHIPKTSKPVAPRINLTFRIRGAISNIQDRENSYLIH